MQIVVDFTEYANCNGLFHDSRGNPVEANTCHMPFKFGGNVKAEGGRSRKKTKGERRR